MPTWPKETIDAVTHDVWFALWHKLSKRFRPMDDLDRRVVAHAIVEYLQLANWEIKRGPPGENTSPPSLPKRR
jgi:hypothetical protein